ncbi:MarR family transcriptional regulator [Planococcus sp. N028]|uniref:HTH-type transcriptional regulator SarZ n=1 Tax=Planococcus shixiaomingii TaxID=3058393 RepID=A0ABT8N563_9BACL|nr:MarR family transcriptional regulator [Planococcus sp. N028]MDN7242675.1 MarR family transcriptional regulator [Planococcus sp. N028]
MVEQSKLDQQLCFELYKASSNFTKLYARTLDPFDLTFPQYLVLLVLWEEDRLLTKDIGERLGLGIGTLNPIISRMIAHGRLSKQQSEEDKRAYIISLTQKAIEEKAAIEQAVYDKLISCNIIGTNAITLMRNLKELNAAFAEMDLESTPPQMKE